MTNIFKKHFIQRISFLGIICISILGIFCVTNFCGATNTFVATPSDSLSSPISLLIKEELSGSISARSNYNIDGAVAEISLKKDGNNANFGELFSSLLLETGGEGTQDYISYYSGESSFNYGLYPDGRYAGKPFSSGSPQVTTLVATILDNASAVGTYTLKIDFKGITKNEGATVVGDILDTLEFTIIVSTPTLNTVISSGAGGGGYISPSSANLTSLVLSGNPTNYTFAGGTYSYTGVTVAKDVNSVTITPTGAGTITVNGVAVASGSASNPIALTAGVESTITVVTTEAGKSSKTYTIRVTRQQDTTVPVTTTPTTVPGLSIPYANPTTADQIEANRAALMSYLINLLLNLSSSTPSTTLTMQPFTGTLQLGMNNDEVKRLQQFLVNQGSDIYPEGHITGYFGNMTLEAVGRFQMAHGIVSSSSDAGYGIVGPQTRAKINSLISTTPTTPTTPATPTTPNVSETARFTTTLQLGMNNDEVKRLQQFLVNQGGDIYPEGHITGYFGNMTLEAVGRFQMAHGIVSSSSDAGYGIVGPQTRAKINSILGY